MTEVLQTISCEQCKTISCRQGYPEGMPDWCQGQLYHDTIDQAKPKYLQPQELSIHVAAAKVIKMGYNQWTRLQETIEFARELRVKKLGIATCVGLLDEAREMVRYFKRGGLNDLVVVGCMMGGIGDRETGIPEEYGYRYHTTCNPITQAEVLNREGTDLNVMVGLCIGHDTLFLKYSKAPVTVFAVKDRVTCNNPTAVLFSPFHRMRLNEAYKKT
ncbi:MAG: DUF1847 domain-containing protein [Chloroflexi bacterium]|nr:DUF1847 domain-containing protein [Chloroflexota bacterium]